MPHTLPVRADIEISEAGVLSVDIIVPKGHRDDGLTFLERLAPGIRALDRSIRNAPESPSHSKARQ